MHVPFGLVNKRFSYVFKAFIVVQVHRIQLQCTFLLALLLKFYSFPWLFLQQLHLGHFGSS